MYQGEGIRDQVITQQKIISEQSLRGLKQVQSGIPKTGLIYVPNSGLLSQHHNLTFLISFLLVLDCCDETY